MLSDKDYIALYRTLAEKKFMLGSEEGRLKQRELEYLANLIEEKSKVKLSISTLKRLWRNDTNQLPHPSTLDALVSILNFKDWQDFKTQNAGVILVHAEKVISNEKKRNVSLPIFILLGIIILTAGFFVIQGFNQKQQTLSISKEILFTADKTVTSGVPNTVMFHYDLSGVQADSFFIQQSWNPRDKVQIDPKKNYYSAIYYTPGFHWARIMANDSILKFTNVHIKTDGWLPLIKYDISEKKHMYLDADLMKKDGVMLTTTDALYKANVDISKDFHLRYYNIRDFDNIDAGNFDLETRMKCDRLVVDGRSSQIACPLMEIMIITEQNVFFVPLTTKGCVSQLKLLIGEVYKDGKDNDLSALGTDVYDWQLLRIRSENKNTTLFLNGVPVHELIYHNNFGKIKGIIYTFTGTGSVDFIKMKNVAGEMVYEEGFEEVQ